MVCVAETAMLQHNSHSETFTSPKTKGPWLVTLKRRYFGLFPENRD